MVVQTKFEQNTSKSDFGLHLEKLTEKTGVEIPRNKKDISTEYCEFLSCSSFERFLSLNFEHNEIFDKIEIFLHKNCLQTFRITNNDYCVLNMFKSTIGKIQEPSRS